ncbi:hypothetical protein CFP56_034573 [Quercus suber]|uniref:Uncharacterized protein n=1 Tax=Quercus suber TaxID=58331 RepID=A0AAW0JBV4_QUESU
MRKFLKFQIMNIPRDNASWHLLAWNLWNNLTIPKNSRDCWLWLNSVKLRRNYRECDMLHIG